MSMQPIGDTDDDAHPVSEINVTPLVDVMLVLLVIFMVTAPMLTAGVAVDLPRTAAAPLSPPQPPLELSMTREGGLFIGPDALEFAALEPRLVALHTESPDRALHLRADRGIEYGEVLRIMGLVQRAGIAKVALVSMPGGDAPAVPGAPAQSPSIQAAPSPAATGR
ncbi:biopolymer transporter ExbD [Paeniroseomonas aquatica]|uniref:Biopolymer transporter ExbD n=1 Tax=Paeniroseomonas aquatica TaxID=373043 RepID=A0ABT8AF48_9PROT|nr:biopolymer transporter ExbD [Paeniroseomonas aquatica]MDN3568300.1 biopolymer transporter ExbD [Paeniroseomonas aquatica]